MSESIIVAIITGGISLIGTVFTILTANRKVEENLKISQAVTDTKIEELTREVRAHKNFAQRMPVVEHAVETLTDGVNELRKYHME